MTSFMRTRRGLLDADGHPRQSSGGAQRLSLVGPLPWQVEIWAAEMPECRGLPIDRAAHVELLDDRAGPQVEVLAHQPLDRLVAHLTGAKRLTHDRDGMGLADRVRNLQLESISQAGRHDVLGNVPRRVGAGAVDLGGIFAGERAATMSC